MAPDIIYPFEFLRERGRKKSVYFVLLNDFPVVFKFLFIYFNRRIIPLQYWDGFWKGGFFSTVPPGKPVIMLTS